MPQAHAVFLVNLVQDVNTLRPLVFMAARDFGFSPMFLVTHLFSKRDASGIWQQELDEIAGAVGAGIFHYEHEADALPHLLGKGGLIFSGSESNLSAHTPTHNLFRSSPPSFITVTLQHGFECVGFRQSRDHTLAHGREVTFGADVVCAWCEEECLTDLAPSQHPKLHVTGPPALLQARPKATVRKPQGLVCENLHSVRLNIAGDFKTSFVSIFQEFCSALAQEGRDVVLRPHPGGQYVLKNNIAFPENVTLNNHPIYKVALSSYAYGISAPSSILIDMVLAGIPTAVWRDGSRLMDADNYQGLTEISSLSDWLDFSREATANPDRFLERQQAFLERQQMPLDPEDVYQRFATLFLAAKRRMNTTPFGHKRTTEPKTRVMFIANGYIPTLQLSFLKPLDPLVRTGQMTIDFITEEQMKEAFGRRLRDGTVHTWLDKKLESFGPTLLVFCRYSGPHAEYITGWARRQNVPAIYHIDDDLLGIPPELGESKYKLHNHPLRLAAVRHMLTNADLVYCSTQRLKERAHSVRGTTPIVAGKIYASGKVINKARQRPVRRIGYMASADHAHNLGMILPAVVQFLRNHPDITFEFFGSIPKPKDLEAFGDRIRIVPPVKNYADFLTEFAKREWDIGLCPLAPIPFNLMKANTKWVEYTAVGAAVVASRDTVYDECCADGCGLLATTNEEWLAALEHLTNNPEACFAQISRAQEKLTKEYSSERLQEQVLEIFEQARVHQEQSPASLFKQHSVGV